MWLNKKMRQKQSGQIALILVLIMTVVSAVVLSAVSGVVTNLRVTGVDEESSEALRVAEAGVEEALRTLTAGSDTVGGVTYNVALQSEGINGFVTEEDVIPGEVVELNLTNNTNRPSSIVVYWGDAADAAESPIGAIEVISYRRYSAVDIRAIHAAYDTDSSRAATTAFSVSTEGAGTYQNVSFMAKQTIAIDNRDQFIRIKPFYKQQKIGIALSPAGSQLAANPYQRVVSEAETAGGVTRKVEALKTEEALPFVFDMALYSGGSLIQ